MEQSIETPALGRRALLRRATATEVYSSIVPKSTAPPEVKTVVNPDEIVQFRSIVDYPRHIHYCIKYVVDSEPSDEPFLDQASQIPPLTDRDDSVTIATMSKSKMESKSRSTNTIPENTFGTLDEAAIRDEGDPVECENDRLETQSIPLSSTPEFVNVVIIGNQAVDNDVTQSLEDPSTTVLDFGLDTPETDIGVGYDRTHIDHLEAVLKALDQEYRDFGPALNDTRGRVSFVTNGVEGLVASALVKTVILAFEEIEAETQAIASVAIGQTVGSAQYNEILDRGQDGTVYVGKSVVDESASVGATALAEHDIMTSILGRIGVPGADTTEIATAANFHQDDGSSCRAGHGIVESTSETRAEHEMQFSSGGERCPSPTDLSQQDPVGGHRPNDVTIVGDEARSTAQPTVSPFSEGRTRRVSSLAT
ncbi:hypothetical protein [Haloarcula amylolytica]|uniref:hypothetical protein n=1 Tax=Haloarcula amylolytica TaxID=396317 RepID=UPI003C712BD1